MTVLAKTASRIQILITRNTFVNRDETLGVQLLLNTYELLFYQLKLKIERVSPQENAGKLISSLLVPQPFASQDESERGSEGAGGPTPQFAVFIQFRPEARLNRFSLSLPAFFG